MVVFKEINSISIIGLGYVGLPTAAILADSGFKVFGIDINEELVSSLNKGILKFEEKNLFKLFNKNIKSGNLQISSRLHTTDAYIICVPTPCNEDKKADLAFLNNAVENISKKIKNSSIVIIESTIPVGTTEFFRSKMLDLISNRGINDIYFAHCPERVLPGNAVFEIINNDRVIGGIDSDSTKLAASIYERFSKGNIFLTFAKVAEMVKLAENTFRDVNIALANQYSIIANKFNIDVNEVINLANKHPRVNIHNPSIGVGGHCIPIDPNFLIENYKEDLNLIKIARLTNQNMELLITEKISEYIDKTLHCNLPIYLYGLTYKKNVNDFRESPAIRIAKSLGLKYSNKKFFLIDPFFEKDLDENNLFFRRDITNLENTLFFILVKHIKLKKEIFDKNDFDKKNIIDLSNGLF